MESVELKVQQKHDVPQSAWLSPRLIMKARFRCCCEAELSAQDQLNEKSEPQIISHLITCRSSAQR